MSILQHFFGLSAQPPIHSTNHPYYEDADSTDEAFDCCVAEEAALRLIEFRGRRNTIAFVRHPPLRRSQRVRTMQICTTHNMFYERL